MPLRDGAEPSTMNTLLCLLVLAASSVDAPKPARDEGITFESAGASAERLLQDLSAVAGTRLSASGPVREEVLIVSVKDVPLSKLMDAIAQSAAAEWQESSGGFQLVRSSTLNLKQERTSLSLKAKRIEKSMDKLREKVAARKTFDAAAAKTFALELEAFVSAAEKSQGQNTNYQAQSRFAESLPLARLAEKLTLLLDPAEIAKLEAGYQHSFAIHPNRVQRALPGTAQALVEEFARQQTLLSAELPQRANANYIAGLDNRLWEAISQPPQEDRMPAVTILKIRPPDFFGDGIRSEVVVYNAAGKSLGSSYAALNELNSEDWPPKPGKAVKGEKPIELPAMATELIAGIRTAISRGGSNEAFPEVSEALRKALANPERTDPAALAAGPMLIATAKQRNLNLVSTMSDLGLFLLPMMAAAEFTTPSQVLEAIKQPMIDLEAQESDGWLIVKAVDPYDLRTQRISRSVMGQMVRAAQSKGFISIEELANLSLNIKTNIQQSVLMPFLMIAAPDAIRSVEGMQWEFVKLHGMLSVQQKRVLESGATLQFRSLTPDVQTHLAKMIYGEQVHGFRMRRTIQDSEEDGGLSGNAKHEPTIRFPNGLPPNLEVRMTHKSGVSISYKGTYDDRFPTGGDWDIEGLAGYLMSKDAKGPENWAAKYDITSFQVGQKDEVHYEISADPQLSFVGNLSQMRLEGKPVSSPEQLPPDVWKQIQEALQRRKASQSGRIPPFMGPRP